MKISIIVARDLQGVIGRDGDLPWRLPADLKHFKKVTMGHPIVMGRRTYESIGRPLPGRQNIVLTTNPDFSAEGCDIAPTLDEAFALAAATLAQDDERSEVMVIGGGAIYAAVLKQGLVDRIYLTTIQERFEGDTFFPNLDPELWRESEFEEHEADEKNPHNYRFSTFERI